MSDPQPWIMDRDPERTITITIGGRSDRGIARSENQDYFLIADLGRTPESGGLLLLPGREPRAQTLELGPAGALALVADGMGGAAGGELASRLAAETILDDLARSAPDHHFALRLRTAVEAANARIHQESRGNHPSGGWGPPPPQPGSSAISSTSPRSGTRGPTSSVAAPRTSSPATSPASRHSSRPASSPPKRPPRALNAISSSRPSGPSRRSMSISPTTTSAGEIPSSSPPMGSTV